MRSTNARAKAALAAHCGRAKQRLVMCGAGGRIDPTRAEVDDLARTAGDALLSKVRSRLRRDYGFPRDAGKKFGIEAVFSSEPIVMPREAACDIDAEPNPRSARRASTAPATGRRFA